MLARTKCARLGVFKCSRRRRVSTRALYSTRLRISQSEFDRQVEITKLLMEGLSQSQTNHLRHLQAAVEAQVQYYAQAHLVMQELNREMASGTLVGSTPVQPNLLVETNGNSGNSSIQDDLAQVSLASSGRFPEECPSLLISLHFDKFSLKITTIFSFYRFLSLYLYFPGFNFLSCIFSFTVLS